MANCERVKWDESLATGIDEIDRQHKYFILMLSEIQLAIEEKDPDLLRGEMMFMDRYANWHFSTEEKFMRLYNFPDFENHRKAHWRFREETKRLIESVSRDVVLDPESYSLEIRKYLVDWFVAHIKGMDMKFVEYLNEKNLQLPHEEIPEEFKKKGD